MCDPVSATIAVAAAAQQQQASKARKSAEQMAAEQRAAQQQAENQRMAEMQAEAERQRQAEQRRQANIAQGESEIATAFGQFGDEFYGNRSKAYQDFAAPQLDKQFADQQRALTVALARSGNLNSSLRGELTGKLKSEYDAGRLSIANTAQQYADQAKTGVTQARARLSESNRSLADPGTIRNSALAEAQGLMSNPSFSSLGQLLSDLSATVTGGKTKINPNAVTAGTQLFGGLGSGSGRVVG
jgi:ATPase subunit of ABC transporter with duplicated ATPase domains